MLWSEYFRLRIYFSNCSTEEEEESLVINISLQTELIQQVYVLFPIAHNYPTTQRKCDIHCVRKQLGRFSTSLGTLTGFTTVFVKLKQHDLHSMTFSGRQPRQD